MFKLLRVVLGLPPDTDEDDSSPGHTDDYLDDLTKQSMTSQERSLYEREIRGRNNLNNRHGDTSGSQGD